MERWRGRREEKERRKDDPNHELEIPKSEGKNRRIGKARNPKDLIYVTAGRYLCWDFYRISNASGGLSRTNRAIKM